MKKYSIMCYTDKEAKEYYASKDFSRLTRVNNDFKELDAANFECYVSDNKLYILLMRSVYSEKALLQIIKFCKFMKAGNPELAIAWIDRKFFIGF
jgi:hypothetical protein